MLTSNINREVKLYFLSSVQRSTTWINGYNKYWGLDHPKIYYVSYKFYRRKSWTTDEIKTFDTVKSFNYTIKMLERDNGSRDYCRETYIY